MNSFIYLAPVAGVIALIFAFYKAMTINKSEAGNDRMKEIASAIAEGARAFLFAEYKGCVDHLPGLYPVDNHIFLLLYTYNCFVMAH